MCAQEFQQAQKQSQSFLLAPQLQNSLKILQAPAVELRASILKELEVNPLLEELPVETISIEEHTVEPDENEQDTDEALDFDAEDYRTLERMNEDLRESFAEENPSTTTESEARREYFMNSLTSNISLQQHLIEQAELAECTDKEHKALLYLIGSLDDNGFLTETISNISLAIRIPYSSVQKAAELLKTFEPSGIGTTGIQDCLISQLALKGRSTSLAIRILQDHFELLIRRRIPELSRKTGTTVDDIQTAIKEISALDPAPGKNFNPDHNTIIEPDVTISKNENGEWQIALNNEYIPRIRISSIYKEMLGKETLGRQEKNFMLEHMRSGKCLIHSIEQRQKTIERISWEILRFQNEFFEDGVGKLRPLTMNTIAQKVDVHETTISRAISNKYIRTPYGIFPFKYFFTPGFTSGSGEVLSNQTIKDMISRTIGEENPAKPLSDQAIVDIFKEKEIRIARRTVAKYREELGILPTHLRRQYER